MFAGEVSADEDDEVSTLQGDLVDLEPLLRDAVVLALPFQPVCEDDCPGLCIECGARLADDPGHTHEAAIDPRWAYPRSKAAADEVVRQEHGRIRCVNLRLAGVYDEPFAGLDPISMGVTANLIRNLNDALGSTSILVSHDVHESFSIADHVYFLSQGRIVAQGTPAQMMESDDPYVKQFVHAQADGPVPFHYPGRSIAEQLGVKESA